MTETYKITQQLETLDDKTRIVRIDVDGDDRSTSIFIGKSQVQTALVTEPGLQIESRFYGRYIVPQFFEPGHGPPDDDILGRLREAARNLSEGPLTLFVVKTPRGARAFAALPFSADLVEDHYIPTFPTVRLVKAGFSDE